MSSLCSGPSGKAEVSELTRAHVGIDMILQGKSSLPPPTASQTTQIRLDLFVYLFTYAPDLLGFIFFYKLVKGKHVIYVALIFVGCSVSWPGAKERTSIAFLLAQISHTKLEMELFKPFPTRYFGPLCGVWRFGFSLQSRPLRIIRGTWSGVALFGHTFVGFGLKVKFSLKTSLFRRMART